MAFHKGFHKAGADTLTWLGFGYMFVISVSACVFFMCERPDVCCRLNCLFSPPGRSSLFPIDDNLLDDGHGNQGVPGVLGSPNCYPHQNGERIERFSRKVFVGGLPPDIDEGEDNTTVQQHSISGVHYTADLCFFYYINCCSLHLFSLSLR